MRYMGGKFRQSKKIAKVIKENHGTGFKYCEPFCGAMWSATKVIKECAPSEVILSDINKPLILLWEGLIKDEIELPKSISFDEYQHRKNNQDLNDPLTAWCGIEASFGGGWYNTFARRNKGDQVWNFEPGIRSTMKKVEVLRTVPSLKVSYNDYWDTLRNLEDRSVIYLDPPYEGSRKAHIEDTKSFKFVEFWNRVRVLSEFHHVYTTSFIVPEDFEVIYNWGNTTKTVSSQKTSVNQVEEVLVKYKGGQ